MLVCSTMQFSKTDVLVVTVHCSAKKPVGSRVATWNSVSLSHMKKNYDKIRMLKQTMTKNCTFERHWINKHTKSFDTNSNHVI